VFRFPRLILLAFVTCTSCVPREPDLSHACNRVDLRAAYDGGKGDIGVWGDKMTGYSRMRGYGPIIYVDLVPPPQADNSQKVLSLHLRGQVGGKPSPVCELGRKFGPDGLEPALHCTQSIPGQRLNVGVTFAPQGVKGPEKRTRELVKYVEDKVLCRLD